jgi:RNA polymerase-binding transcription factor DksA
MSASARDHYVMQADVELSDEDRQELRRRLLAEREALLTRAGDLLDEDDRSRQSGRAHAHGDSERAVLDAERRVNAVLEAGTRDALDEVVDALARVEDGTYGRCADCDAPIPRERLHARPAARFCVRCQQRRDAGRQY